MTRQEFIEKNTNTPWGSTEFDGREYNIITEPYYLTADQVVALGFCKEDKVVDEEIPIYRVSWNLDYYYGDAEYEYADEVKNICTYNLEEDRYEL